MNVEYVKGLERDGHGFFQSSNPSIQLEKTEGTTENVSIASKRFEPHTSQVKSRALMIQQSLSGSSTGTWLCIAH